MRDSAQYKTNSDFISQNYSANVHVTRGILYTEKSLINLCVQLPITNSIAVVVLQIIWQSFNYLVVEESLSNTALYVLETNPYLQDSQLTRNE